MINDKPLDIEAAWPRPFDREQARERLAGLIEDQEAAQEVWNDLLAPLYDALRARAVYSGTMSCRVCGKPHAASYRAVQRAAKGLEPMKHAMHCPHYVGPLEHRRVSAVNDTFSITGEAMSTCACGRRYPYWDDENQRVTADCPDAAVDYRDARPLG